MPTKARSFSRNWRIRRWRANWRDTLILLRQFGWPLAMFVLAVLGGGLAYRFLAQQAGEPVASLAEAVYLILGLTFFQPIAGFPRAWYLEVFYFAMPLIGIGILAQGIADFGVSFFNRRTRNKEWEIAVASTFRNHIVLVGLGHLGYRVVQILHSMDQDVVTVELNPKADLVANVRGMGIPVIQEDGTRQAILEAAGIEQARSIILCTQNDSLNLQIAVKARSLNPRIQVVVRIFDDDFAQALQAQFGFIALSATGMAAPAFASAAAGVDMTRPITVEGRSLSLARLQVDPQSRLIGQSIGQIEKIYNLSIVLLRHEDNPDLHPGPLRTLDSGDLLAVLGGPEEINTLVQDVCFPA